MATLEEQLGGKDRRDIWRQFPWWLVVILTFLLVMLFLIITNEEYNKAFNFIKGSMGSLEDLLNGDLLAFVGKGLSLTVFITFATFLIAIFLGLIAGLGRVSKNTVIRNLAITYVEFVRGLPILVLIFTINFLVVPEITGRLGLQTNFPEIWRGILALAFFYGAFMAEIFRSGIESIPNGQTEAARSLGMSIGQTLRFIILPQAIRNVLPALGNDFIAVLKDSSLLSVLAVREITQQSRLYSSSSFKFQETYLVLTFMYLSMTLALSLVLQWYGRRLKSNER